MGYKLSAEALVQLKLRYQIATTVAPMYVAPGFPSDVGREAIKVAYQSYFEAYDLQRDFTLTEVDMSTDFATRTGEWTQLLTPTDGSDPITEVGRCILGRKKVEGEWKVAWEIWNTFDAPGAIKAEPKNSERLFS